LRVKEWIRRARSLKQQAGEEVMELEEVPMLEVVSEQTFRLLLRDLLPRAVRRPWQSCQVHSSSIIDESARRV
jgi:hypothetical protein